MGVCDFTDTNGVSHDHWNYDYNSLGGGYKYCTYGRWTVQGFADFILQNRSYRINVTGIFPAPRQPLNLVCSSQCDVEQRNLAIAPANCSIDMNVHKTPDLTQTYAAYPQIMPLTGAIILLVLATLITIGFAMLGFFVLRRNSGTFPESLSLT
jgi:hypothetical protein